jgi:hypothetical protein
MTETDEAHAAADPTTTSEADRVGRVFISYASPDRGAADAIVKRLESNGIMCWIAHRDIRPGQIWSTVIATAIASSAAMLVYLTDSANTSRYVHREVQMGHDADKLLIPLVAADVQMSKALTLFLSSIQHIGLDDLGKPSVLQALREQLPAYTPDRQNERTEVARVANSIARVEDKTLWRVYASAESRIVVFGFYLVSFAILFSDMREFIAPTSYMLAFAAGVLVVVRTRQLNLLVLFTIGCIQPLLLLAPRAWSEPHLVWYVMSVPVTASVGLACAAGGLLISLRFGPPPVSVLSIVAWRAWLFPSWSVLTGGEKVEAVIKVVAVILVVLLWAYVALTASS